MRVGLYLLNLFLAAAMSLTVGTAARSEEGNLTEAVLTRANAALEKNSDDHGALFIRARAYFFKKDYTKAEKDIDRAINLAPDSPLYRYHRIEVLLRRKKPEAVLKEAEEGLGDAMYGVFLGAEALKLDDEVDELIWLLPLNPMRENDLFQKLLPFKERAARRELGSVLLPPPRLPT
jgi:tetratricopeptide (TPR) repeat protein